MTLIYALNLANSITILILGLIVMNLQKQLTLHRKRADVHSQWLRAVSDAQVTAILGTDLSKKE